MFAHGETVLRLRGGTSTDPYSGDPTTDWSTSDLLRVEGCGVAAGGSLEPEQDARDAVTSDFDIVMPAGTDVGAADRVVVRGLTCEVVGRPFEWRSPFTGWQPGMVVRAQIREG